MAFLANWTALSLQYSHALVQVSTCISMYTHVSSPLVCSGAPSKLDYDVLQALCGSEVQRSLCPLLHDWLQTVTAFSEQEQKT